MLFIDNYQTGIIHRREDRRTGPQDNPGPAVGNPVPGFGTLAGSLRAVDNHDPVAEPPFRISSRPSS